MDSFIRIIEEGIGTPWQQVLLIFGCFLIAVALLGRFWLKEATPVPRSAVILVLGIVALVLGFLGNLYEDWIRGPHASNLEPYRERQVRGKIIEVHAFAGGLAVRLDPSSLEYIDPAKFQEYENKNDKRLSDTSTWLGSHDISPTMARLLLGAYLSGQRVLVALKGVNPDGMYSIDDAYLGQD
jgi:hypothetical protein